MPWVDPPADPLTFRAPMGQDTGEVRPPSLGDVMSSAWSRDSAVVDTWRRLHEENYPIDPGYNPLDDERVKGTKYETQYLGKFSRSYSAKETKKIIADIERDERDTANIDAGGAAGFAASVMAGMTDPTIFIPGGAIYRGAKGGISALRTMGSTALAGGAQVGIQEAMLQSSHPLRTKEESLINIGTGALLAGLIGGGAARFMSKAEQAALRGAMEENRRILGPSAAGAAASDLRTGELRPLMPNVISRGYTRAREAVAKVPYVGKAAEAVMKLPELLTTKGNPLMRLHTSESQAARRAILDLAESPLETMDNELGITSSKFGIPLESDVKLSVYQAQSELYQASNDLFSDYRFKGRAMLPAARSYLEKRFGKSTDLTFDDFMAEVDAALRNKDQHPIPQVQQLAAKFRRWFDTVKDLAKAQGIDIGDDVLGADSFAPRVYDRMALTRDRPEFTKRYVNWRKQDQAKKSALRDDLEREWDILMNTRVQARKVEGRLATAERRLTDTEARLSERRMEAKVTLDRNAKASERNREKQAAISELKSFIDELKSLGDTSEIRQQIADLEGGVRQLEADAQPISLEDLDSIDKAERDGILTGPMRRVARIVTGKSKNVKKPPSFARYVAKMGGVKDSGGDLLSMADKFPGLFKKDGIQWDDLQQRLGEAFPELKARGYSGEGALSGQVAEDFSDEIRQALTDSINGTEPEWFLKEMWPEDERFVFEMSQLIDETANQAGVDLKTYDDVAAFIRGDTEGLSESDFDKMQASIGDSGAGLDRYIEADGLRQRITIRNQTIELYKQTLEKARKNLVSAKAKAGTSKAVAKETANSVKRNLGRLGILNERAAKASNVKAFLEQAQELAKANSERQLARIEDILNRWEGKSAADAQAAMKRRGEYDAGRTAEQKAAKPRLEGADKAIASAVRRILKSEELSDQEIVAEAEQAINQILSTPDGRLPKDEPGTVRGFSPRDGMGDLRGSLNARKLPMPDNDLLPFLVRNPLDYTMRYLRQGMSDLNMIARFGDTEGTNVLKDIADEYDAMIRAAPDAKRRVALQKAKEDDIRDFAAIRDRLKGIYGFSPDAFMQSAGRVATAIKDLNVATLGGGFGLAQFPDFAGVVFRNGFMSALKDGWRPFFGKLTRIGGEGMKAAAKDYRAFGLGAETFQSTRMLDAMDAHDIYHHKTPFERTLRLTGQSVVTLSGMTIATDAQKVIASTVAGNNILRAAKAIGDGSASGRTITAMAAGGIDAPMAQRIWTAFEKDGGNVVDGTYLPNLDDWSDKEAARRFMAAVIRDVEIAVLTPGQEKSLFLSSPIISLFGQFKTFTASATTRILLANLQRRDAAALSGLVTQVALGMMSYAAYTAARGGELHERPQDWIKEGIDRSGVIGWFGDINAMTAKGTGGQADLFRLIGADKPLSRYASRGLVGNLLGPAYGKAGDIADMTYAASNGQWTESDMRKLRQLIPFQNLFYLRQLFDEVERNTNSAFGIEPREANR